VTANVEAGLWTPTADDRAALNLALS
jgi:hypothetical protein